MAEENKGGGNGGRSSMNDEEDEVKGRTRTRKVKREGGGRERENRPVGRTRRVIRSRGVITRRGLFQDVPPVLPSRSHLMVCHRPFVTFFQSLEVNEQVSEPSY